MAMELLEGDDLCTWASSSAATTTTIASIGAQIADALTAMHTAGLVHRDLKPENIIVLRGTAPDGGVRIKLIDFGIVAHVGAGEHGPRLTRNDLTLGTVFYMSPEQAVGGSVDGRADLYALGCILWELATGRPLFGAGTPTEVLVRQIGQAAEPPSALNPAIPGWLDEVILKCLAKKPEQRFQTAGELRHALVSGLAPATAVKPKRVWLHSTLGAALGFAAATVLAVTGGIGVTAGGDPVADGHPPPVAVAGAPPSSEVETPGGVAALPSQVPRSNPPTTDESRAELPLGVGPDPGDAPDAEAEVRVVSGPSPVEPTPEPVRVEDAPTAAQAAAPASSGAVSLKASGPTQRAATRLQKREAEAPDEPVAEVAPIKVGPRMAQLTFAIEPRGATVTRNGQVLGKTPFTIEVVAFETPVTYEVRHPERVGLRLVYPREEDRLVSRTLDRIVAAERTPRPTEHPTAGIGSPNTEGLGPPELWRPPKPSPVDQGKVAP
jgi:serine/threonine-protein kinase